MFIAISIPLKSKHCIQRPLLQINHNPQSYLRLGIFLFNQEMELVYESFENKDSIGRLLHYVGGFNYIGRQEIFYIFNMPTREI